MRSGVFLRPEPLLPGDHRMKRTSRKGEIPVANCSNNHGCACGGRGSCTRVGALSTLSRPCGRYPYYTGPCPPAPCVNKCGTCAANRCGCGCANAAVTTECEGCTGCGNGCANGHGCGGCNTCGCNHGHACGCNSCDCGCEDDCDDGCGSSWNCASCGRSNCGEALNCAGCGKLRSGCGAGHAAFSASGPIRLSEGGTVGFEACHADSDAFSTSYGSILIRRPGLYFAAVTVDIPANTETDTVMRLELDHQNIAPHEIAVNTCDDGTTSNYAGHAVFHAKAGSLLKLRSLKELSIHCAAAQPVFTLTIFRLA